MRIAKNLETDPVYKYTVTRDLYSTIGNNTSDVKIFIIFQHITYGEVAGYSLRDSDSILCWIRSRLLVVGWGARLRIIRCKSAAGAGPLSWSSDQVILELQLESYDCTAFKHFRFLNKRLVYTPESVRNYLTQ